jgi:hypothetical protein
MKTSTPKLFIVLAIVITATVFRLLPHWPNFTPLAAIALLSGAYIRDKKLALLVPMLALFVSDLVTIQWLNPEWLSVSEFFTSPGTIFIYAGFFLMTFIGFGLRKSVKAKNIAGSALACALIFFLLSNFGVWLINDLPKDMAGLLATYAQGIPFFGYDLAGNLFYSFVSFALVSYLVKTWPQLAVQPLGRTSGRG